MGKRVRGQGSVRKREDTGKYVIDYYDKLGKRHIETIGTNKNEAIDKLEERRNQVKHGTLTASIDEKLFKEFSETWLTGKVGVKESTKTSYEGIVANYLDPHFGKGRLSEIRREDIRGFVKTLTDKGELSAKSIHNILLVLHQILDDAQIEGLLSHNPYIKIEKPKREKAKVDYLRTFEIPIFLKAAQAYREPKEKVSKISDGAEKKKEKPKCETTIHALFHTDIFTGMRRGELLGAQWANVDWVSGKIHVERSLYKGRFQTPKSEYSVRAIDAGPRLLQVLKEHRAKQNETRLKVGSEWVDNDLIFSDNEGRPLDADNLYHRDFRAILKKAGLRAIRIHDLRHTFASILIAAGHNIKYIQSQMGHSSIKVTLDLYGHLMPEVYQGAAKKSEDFVYGNVMVTDNEKGVTPETQPLEMLGSGGLI